MKENIKNYLPYYIGQECICDSARFKITGIQFTEAGTGVFDGTFNDGIPQGWWIENCDFKLLLRPLSDMTEEEEMNVSNIIGSITATSFIEAWIYKSKYLINIHEYPDLFIYLLEQGFDLFGLIEAGIAINKNKSK